MPTAKRIREGVHSNWFWISGRKFGIYPSPNEDTQIKVSGSCTVSGSEVTASVGYSKNSLIDYLCKVGNSYFIINSNTTTSFVVNGVPDSSATTFEIYKLGIQIRYLRVPDFLTDSEQRKELDR